MAMLDSLIPTNYRVSRMGIENVDGSISVQYDVEILNASGGRVGVLHPRSELTAGEKAAMLAIFARDRAVFEAATGLTAA